MAVIIGSLIMSLLVVSDGFRQLKPITIQYSPFSRICGKHSFLLQSSIALPNEPNQTRDIMNPFYARLAQPVSLGPHVQFKGKVLNAWGLFYAITTYLVATAVLPFMWIISVFTDIFGNSKQRRILDWIVHIWAKWALQLSFCFPRVYGLENLPPHGEPFKYLSKSEILKLPLIGWGMKMAMHVFLSRGDLRSTLEVSDTCVKRLKDGNSMVLFAEGTRSADGRLQTFKKGAFQIAKAAGVRVVPVSIGNLHRVMPKHALLPIAPLRHAFIKIHPPIDSKNKNINQLRIECQEAVNYGLPVYQQFVKGSNGSTANSGDGSV